LLVRGAIAPQAFRPYRYHVQRGLERLALSATLPPELGSLRVSSVHLSYESTTAREAQARETASALLSAAHPSLDVLVGGRLQRPRGLPHPLPRWAPGATGTSPQGSPPRAGSTMSSYTGAPASSAARRG
jgi:hypothetical protein